MSAPERLQDIAVSDNGFVFENMEGQVCVPAGA